MSEAVDSIVDSRTVRVVANEAKPAGLDRVLDFDLWVALPQEPVVAVSEQIHHGEVSAEDVEGLPLRLVQLYADVAVRHAIVREVEPGAWLATVAGLDGAWGDGGTPNEARDELREAIVGWVAVKRRVGAADIPRLEGIDLNPRP